MGGDILGRLSWSCAIKGRHGDRNRQHCGSRNDNPFVAGTCTHDCPRRRWCGIMRRRRFSGAYGLGRISLGSGGWFIGSHGNLCDEPISPPRNRLSIAWTVRGIAQSLAHFVDRDAQALVELDIGILGPEVCLNLLPRHHLACAIDKESEQPQRLILDSHPMAPMGEKTVMRIEQEVTEGKSGKPDVRFRHRDSQQSGSRLADSIPFGAVNKKPGRWLFC